MLRMLLRVMKEFIFAKGDPEALLNIMRPSTVGVLSAQCCNPSVTSTDDQLLKAIDQALTDLNINTKVHFVTISTAQKSLRQLSGKLSVQQQELVNQLMGLFQSKGIGVFPVLLVNGRLSSYGGVPSVGVLREKLSELAASDADTIQQGI